jgi:hypothetical protein
MSECYYHWCEYHHKDEPFCSLDMCVRTTRQLENYAKLREVELEQNKRTAE